MKQTKNYGTLTLRPEGGLGNRLRAIASAVHLASETGVRLNVIWFRDWACRAAYSQLFEPSSLLALRDARPIDYVLDDRPRLKNIFIPKLFQLIKYDQRMGQDESYRLSLQHFDFNAWAKGRQSYLGCYSEFGLPDASIYSRLFHPIPLIMQKVRHNMQWLGNRPIGIHIRRTDNVPSTQQSPVELFTNKVESLLNSNPSQKFFLASDDEPTKELFRKRYGDAIVTNPFVATRRSVEGLQNAVAEMFTLAATTCIYATLDTSFSTIASKIGQTQLVVLHT